MIPYLTDRDLTLYVGDVRDVLADLPDGTVDACVTSPPYWGLRDYGTGEWDGGDAACNHLDRPTGGPRKHGDNFRATETDERDRRQFARLCGKCGARRVDRQLGLEPSVEEYVATLVAVFGEVRRVLAPHGTLWLNLGDSYTSGGRDYRDPGKSEINGGARVAGLTEKGTRPSTPSGLKQKELVGVPWRVAFALQADGWYLRSENIWAKPNPMPESVQDRPTKAHEQVFLLSKARRYYYDREAVLEPYEGRPSGNLERKPPAARGADLGRGQVAGSIPWSPTVEPDPNLLVLDGFDPPTPERRGPDGRRKVTHDHATDTSHENHSQMGDGRDRWPADGRNMRTVWWIPTTPYADAHFAVFPEELPRRCILASVPERVCRTCGKPSERIVERTSDATQPGNGKAGEDGWSRSDLGNGRSGMFVGDAATVGWTDCGHDDWRAGIVLDPFMGSGTTALVARKHGRHAIGVELNAEYAEMIADRNAQQTIFAEEAP